MKIYYAWKELQLLSATTISNIITFIQFAIIPLDTTLRESQNTEESGIKEFITINFGPAAKLFLMPFEFITAYESIAAPMRVALFPTVLMFIFAALQVLFFFPSWRLYMLLTDLFLPGMLLCGILFIAKDYSEVRIMSIIFIVIGIVYIILRIVMIIVPQLDKRNKKWFLKVTHQITAVFLSRLTKDKSPYELEDIMQECREQIYMRERGLIFDENHFSLRGRIIDLILTLILLATDLGLYLYGWKNLLESQFTGKQLEDSVLICNIITAVLMVIFVIRAVFNVLWFIPKIYFLFNFIKPLVFKSIILLTGVILLPVLRTVLQATTTTVTSCGYNQFLDFRSNTDSFLQYFMRRSNVGCVNCTQISAKTVDPCTSVCYYNPEYAPLQYRVLTDSIFVTESDLTNIYLIPMVLLEIFFLAIFLQMIRQIFANAFEIVAQVPAPTRNLQCKFITLATNLRSGAIYLFQNYRFKASLYYFTFTQIKQFVLFFSSLFPVFPVETIQENSSKIIPWLFFFAGMIISISQFFARPYLGVLQNIINCVSYFIGGIASLMIALHTCQWVILSPRIGDAMFILIIATPIVVAIITPLFARLDPALNPINFSLPKILRWDRKLTVLARRRKLKHLKSRAKRHSHIRLSSSTSMSSDISNSDEVNLEDINELQDEDKINKDDDSEVSFLDDVDEDPDRPHDVCIGNFSLLKLSPIVVQQGIKKKVKGFQQKAFDTWKVVDILESDLDEASADMLSATDELLNCISSNQLSTLLNLTVIFCSACFGWCFGAGVATWRKVTNENSEYYLRCNMFENGSYPLYGEY